jgi:hypothetical protein
VAEYTQVARQEIPSTNPLRQGKVDVGYVYMDDRMRTFMFMIPAEEDGAERVQTELAAKVEAAEAGGARRITI